MNRPIPERLQWFIDRISKRVFRNPSNCTCDTCNRVVEEGLIINDAFHAEYLYDCEGEFTAEGTPLRYFDSKQEVENWLKKQEI